MALTNQMSIKSHSGLKINVVFNGVLPNVLQLLDDIKAISWIWFSGRFGRKSFLSFSD
jgi:hypothetical protein